MKANPFQRSNPFQVQSTYQPQISPSLGSYQSKPSYRTYDPQSIVQKQNSFSRKLEPQVWKFRQDNCSKLKVFNHQTNHNLNEKYMQQKNSFQKQLVLSSVGRRNNNNSGQEATADRQYIENPFARKYLMSSGNSLAESHVYVGFGGGTAQQNLSTYERYKTEYESYTPTIQHNTYTYSNYTPTPVQDNYLNQINSNIGSNNNLQTSLHNKHSSVNQYGSRKSLQRQDSYNRHQNSYNNTGNAVESRYSLERQRENKYKSISSNKDIYPSFPSMKDNNFSKASIPLAERDTHSKRYSRVSGKQQKVNFQQSDQQDSRNGSIQKHRQPTFGSKKEIPQLKGPQQITVNGMKFYRQRVQSY